MFAPFETTGIGSLPFKDPEEAAEFALSCCDIPFWPQLPNYSFRELMIPQYSEGLPGVVIDPEKENIFIEEANQKELNRFYDLYSSGADFLISKKFSNGFHAFLDKIRDRKVPFLKGQITGPLTFTLGLKKSDGRYIYFDEELREVASLLLQKKAEWQVKLLSEHAERVIIFIDEPILTAIGSSSYLGVEPKEAERLLIAAISKVKSVGGLSGIHCCGKADWCMLMQTGVDILNFDAYNYFETLNIYADRLREFFERGGYLAWGIVPTTEAVRDESTEKLKESLLSKIDILSEKISRELIISHSMLTPSCGAGSRTPEETRKIFSLLKSLQEAMRE